VVCRQSATRQAIGLFDSLGALVSDGAA